MSRFIDAVIIDTCLFHTLNYDFRGRNNSILPAFKNILRDHEIQFITSPIIKSEILKHVAEKAREETIYINKMLSKYKDIFPLIGVKNLDSIYKRFKKLDLSAKYISEVEEYFCDSYFLPIPKAEEIFKKYFNSTAPFSESGKKKSEFPDAFIIQSVLNYVDENDKEVLAISSDNDWKSAFHNTYGVTILTSLTDAIKYIHEVYTSSKIAELYSDLSLEETVTQLTKKLQDSTFYIDDFYSEVESIGDIFMSSSLNNICPLSISNRKIIYSAIAPMEVTATVSVLDESKSLWDNETRRYLFKEHKLITVTSDIEVYFEAEVSINDDKSVSGRGAVTLNNVNNNKDIKINLPGDYC